MTIVNLPWPAASASAQRPAACDCRTCPFWARNPTNVDAVCSGRSLDCEYCGCSRAETACVSCSVRCSRRTDLADWIADVGGTVSFGDLAIRGRLPKGLPRFIPQIDTAEWGTYDDVLHWPAYAVGLRRVFSPDSHTLTPVWSSAPARTVLGLDDTQLTVLVCTGKDALLEAFWTRRHRDRLITRIVDGGWDLILTPDHSMYGNQPRMEHLINFRRNLLLAAEVTSAGGCAVPHLHWLRKEDIDRYLTWVAGQQPAGPPAVAINLQTCRSSKEWDDVLAGLALLAAELPPHLPVLVSGTSRPGRISTLLALFGDRLHLLSQNPLHAARYGGLMTDTGRIDHPARIQDLFAANVRYYARLLAETFTETRSAGRPEPAPGETTETTSTPPAHVPASRR